MKSKPKTIILVPSSLTVFKAFQGSYYVLAFRLTYCLVPFPPKRIILFMLGQKRNGNDKVTVIFTHQRLEEGVQNWCGIYGTRETQKLSSNIYLVRWTFRHNPHQNEVFQNSFNDREKRRRNTPRLVMFMPGWENKVLSSELSQNAETYQNGLRVLIFTVARNKTIHSTTRFQ